MNLVRRAGRIRWGSVEKCKPVLKKSRWQPKGLERVPPRLNPKDSSGETPMCLGKPGTISMIGETSMLFSRSIPQ